MLKNLTQKWKENFSFLLGNRLYVVVLSLTAVFSYGFLITHQTVGIDDTPYALYFEEGLNAIIGRWFLFLLNKFVHISEFSPFVMDLAGVLVFMAAVTVWGTLLYSICRDRVPVWGYLFFSCIFLSCPLISEVYCYHLHNAVSVGYLCVGISLCFFRELSEWEGGFKKRLFLTAGTAVFLVVALGCYESFMIVWLLGIFLILLTEQYMGMSCKVLPLLGMGALAAVAAMVLRSITIAAVIGMCDLEYMRENAVLRSVTELAGWVFETGGFAGFIMAVKRFYVMYFAFLYAYYPIKIFVTSSFFMVLYGVYASIRRRRGWIAFLTFGCFISCFFLVIVEGRATLYRAAQFLPVVCGYGAFLAVYAVAGFGKPVGKLTGDAGRKNVCADEEKVMCADEEKRTGAGGKKVTCTDGEKVISADAEKVTDADRAKTSLADKAKACHLAFGFRNVIKGITVAILCIILWNQCHEINKWFYVDWMKYQFVVSTVDRIGYDLEQDFDISKPVVFTGTCQPPKGIIGDAYVGYGTETFYKINRLTNPVDEHLLEKFYREYGVWVAQTPSLSVLDWGVNAFGTDEELVHLFSMHGHDLTANTNPEIFEEATEYSMEMPSFPQDGYIEDRGEYVIVHF